MKEETISERLGYVLREKNTLKKQELRESGSVQALS